jgi:serine/threonine-protein kinase
MGPPSPGQSVGAARFGGFDLIARIGVGGVGEVFLAVTNETTKPLALRRGQGPSFGKVCVVKRLLARLSKSQSARRRFEQEACLAARVSHPNVVQTFDVGEVNGVPFMAMEFLHGITMRSLVASANAVGLLPEPTLWVRMVADALAGLHHAHELRDFDGSSLSFVHRDVSPHNIFVTFEGRVCLIDFGMAKLLDGEGPAECRTLAGKPRYMAPEYVARGRVDRRADIFSMGVVLWEALAGQVMPHTELSPRAAAQERPKVSTVAPSVDPALEAIVEKALAIEPMRRYQSARAMQEALEEYLEGAGAPVGADDLSAMMETYAGEERASIEGILQAYALEKAREQGLRTSSEPEEVEVGEADLLEEELPFDVFPRSQGASRPSRTTPWERLEATGAPSGSLIELNESDQVHDDLDDDENEDVEASGEEGVLYVSDEELLPAWEASEQQVSP